MSCTNPQPYLIPFGGGRPRHCMTDLPFGSYGVSGKLVYLPCGNCLACRRERRQDYTCLQVLESLEWSDNWFITLTYDDDHLPKNGSLVRSHLSKFFESLRHYFKSINEPCRYFAVGEYGEKSSRPHYHFSLFGVSSRGLGFKEDDSEDYRLDSLLNRGAFQKIKEGVYDENGNRCWHSSVIGSRWPYGNHQIYRANRFTFQYVAGYVTKKLSGSLLLALKQSGRIPSFSVQSRPSIGYEWWRKHYKRLSILYKGRLYNDCIDVPGMSWRIPRVFEKWYKSKGDIGDFIYLEKVKALRSAKYNDIPDRVDLGRRNRHDEILALRYKQNSTHKDL